MDIKCGWAIIAPSDGTDENGLQEYLNSYPNTRVKKVIYDKLPISNQRTGKEYEVDCIIFLMETDGMFVPPKFRFELNLRACEGNPYLFQVMERAY